MFKICRAVVDERSKDSPRTGFLNLSTIDRLGQIILCREGLSCVLWDV